VLEHLPSTFGARLAIIGIVGKRGHQRVMQSFPNRVAFAVASLLIGANAAAQPAARAFEFTLPDAAPACAPQPGGATTAIALDGLEGEVGSRRGVPLVFANGLTLLLTPDGRLLDPVTDHRGDAVGTLAVDGSGVAVLRLTAPARTCPEISAAGRGIEVAARERERSRKLAAAWINLVAAADEYELARFDSALARIGEAERARTELLGADDALVAMVKNLRAAVTVESGRPREALALLEQRRAQSPPVALRAATGLDLALVGALKWSGRPAVALPLAQQSVVRAAEQFGDDDVYTIRAKRELGQIYRDVRRFDEAIALFEQVRPALIARHGAEGRRTLENDLAIAGTLNEARRSDEALARLDALLPKLRRVYGTDDPMTQLALSNRFSCLFELREHDQALAAVEELLAIRRRVYGPQHPRTLFALRGLAVTQWARGEKAAAIALDRQVIEGYEAAYGPDHPDTLQTIHNAAVALQDSWRFEEALHLATRVVDSVERQQEWASLAPETRQSYFSRWANTYKIKAQLHSQLGDHESAFRTIELTKARTLLDATTTRLARNAAIDDPEERSAVARLEQRLETLNGEHARAIGDPEQRTRLDLERNRTATELRALNDRLGARYPRFAALRELRAVSSSQLQEALPPRTLFLDYSLEGVHVMVAAVSRETGLTTRMLGNVPRLIANLEALSAVISAPDAEARVLWKDPDGRFRLQRPASETTVRPARVAQLAQHISTALLDPVADLIAAHDALIVSPDTALALVPLEAMPFRGEPLIRRVELSYAPSAAVFWISQGLARDLDRRSGRVGLLALGGVDYAGPGAGAAEITGPLDLATLARRADAAHRSFAPLPASRREVERAAQHLQAAGVRTLLGKDANKSMLSAMSRSGELQKYRTLLISAHGVLDAERPALSAIVLAPDADGNRFVTAAEWMTYRLASDLVVASACETARGAAVNGEGVTGLPFAFHAAGSARSLLTLWKVDDESTARFVDALFERLAKGEPPSRALRAVKLQFLGDRRLAQPFFWAPFVLFGAADSR
jgi:CHAT domain-containing protein